jgi:hypothetical protein
MASFKKANWFSVQGHMLKGVNSRLHIWTSYYNEIRHSGWPDCSCVTEIIYLPVEIQNEIFHNPRTEWILKAVLSTETGSYKHQQVWSQALPFLETADAVVKLQDLVNDPAATLKQVFDIDCVNLQQVQLLEDWKTLHPVDLLTSIGISTTRSQHEYIDTTPTRTDYRA